MIIINKTTKTQEYINVEENEVFTQILFRTVFLKDLLINKKL